MFAWLLKYADHRPERADGCLAVLSGRHLNAKVWTYDRKFRTTWRRPDGRAFPWPCGRSGAGQTPITANPKARAASASAASCVATTSIGVMRSRHVKAVAR